MLAWICGLGLLAFVLAFALWFIWHFFKVGSLLFPYYRKDRARYDRRFEQITANRIERAHYADSRDSVKPSSLEDPFPDEDEF